MEPNYISLDLLRVTDGLACGTVVGLDVRAAVDTTASLKEQNTIRYLQPTNQPWSSVTFQLQKILWLALDDLALDWEIRGIIKLKFTAGHTPDTSRNMRVLGSFLKIEKNSVVNNVMNESGIP